MTELIEIFILKVISLVLLSLVILSVIKKWGKDKNKLDLAILMFSFIIFLKTIIQILIMIEIPLDFTIGDGLNLSYLIGLIAIIFPVEFMLYLRQHKKLYLFPVIIDFYIGAGILLFNAIIVFMIFAMVNTLFSIYLVFQGWKNRNGIVFMLGVYIIISGLLSTEGTLIGSLFNVLSIILLYCGTSGFMDKYILINKEEKQRLQNIWISKILMEENA